MSDGGREGASDATGPIPGIIMLDSPVRRVPGEIGHPDTFSYTVCRQVAGGVGIRDVLDPNDRVIESLITAGTRLIACGAEFVTTSCGLLISAQRELAAALPVPVVTSSLLQLPLARSAAGRGRVAVLTADSALMTPSHLLGSGITAQALTEIDVVGMESTQHFYPALTGDLPDLDVDRASDDVIRVLDAALPAQRHIGAIVIECTNLDVYAERVRRETGVSTWCARTLVDAMRAVMPTRSATIRKGKNT